MPRPKLLSNDRANQRYFQMNIPPLTQLQAFADWEAKERPDPNGRKHVAQWAVEEIERLTAELAQLRESGAQHRLLRTKDHTLPGVVFRDIVRNDSYLAKAWHANLTEMAISAGAPPEAAAERASDFMRHTFLVEVS